MAARTEARLSTYSGAPSLQPSLAPTLSSQASSQRSSSQQARPTRQQHPNTTTLAATTNKASTVYTISPAMASTASFSPSSDPKTADIKSWSGALERMQDARLEKQRYVMSGHKSDEVSKLALGAKVERALARRMVGQDASFRVPKKVAAVVVEKRSLEIKAN